MSRSSSRNQTPLFQSRCHRPIAKWYCWWKIYHEWWWWWIIWIRIESLLKSKDKKNLKKTIPTMTLQSTKMTFLKRKKIILLLFTSSCNYASANYCKQHLLFVYYKQKRKKFPPILWLFYTCVHLSALNDGLLLDNFYCFSAPLKII